MTHLMTPAPKRRWSFSLRTLFVVITVLACWLGWGAWAIRYATSDRPLLIFVVVSILVGGNLIVPFLVRFAMSLRRGGFF
jgi:TRAP-type C4-dicarboxylate transport system permease small subunit